MTVWVFGDSYVEERDCDYQWYKQLGRLLDEPVVARGQAGVSNDFVGDQLRLHLEGGVIKREDWVIVVQTQFGRQWFFRDRPELSNFAHHTDPTRIGMTREEKRATDGWLRYLNNWDSLRYQTYASSFANIGLCSWLVGCECLNLPGFDNGLAPYNPFVSVRGSLTEWVSLLEFDTQDSYMQHLAQPGGDSRVNHLSEHNHTVLAQKLYRTRTQRAELDLTQGFHTLRTLTVEDFSTLEQYKEYIRAHTN